MKPEAFPIGSPQSRAAARAERDRRLRAEDESSTVFVFTGMPGPARERETPALQPPDSVTYYTMPDGSIARVIRRYGQHEGDRTLIINIDQTWPDGNDYDGNCLVTSVRDLGVSRGERES